jgi:hypothetical protein
MEFVWKWFLNVNGKDEEDLEELMNEWMDEVNDIWYSKDLIWIF